MAQMPEDLNPSVAVDAALEQRARSLLQRFYGYSNFRPHQLDIIATAMEGRDSVVLMPTGGGKSLCYQLPALMLEGCTVVVSPLISLMNDQVTALRANGIPAATVNSNRSDTDNLATLTAAVRGQVKLLYTSPERLLTDLPHLTSDFRVSLIAIDEAHCISQWGHDFRPVYTRLAELRQRFPGVPVMALTATADRITRDDIVTQLGLHRPRMFVSSFDRPNLSLRVVQGASKREKVAFIGRMIDKYRRDSGIVYCLSRKGAEAMAAALDAKGYRVALYHAGLTAAQRDEAQQRFSDGDVQAVVATIAFGMGIDKSNIRWVVHANMPKNIESYYQEIGRAGRDGAPAETVMFYSVSDLITLRSFVDSSGQPQLQNEKLQRMQAFAEARVCRRRMLLSYFNESMDHDCGNCDVCLAPPKRVDGTVEAMKAMSAAARVGEKVGVTMLIDILRGSSRSELVNAGYHHIKTYGAGRDLSFSQWNTYITQMVQLGLFYVAYDEGNHLKITDYGRRVLRGEARVEFSLPEERTTADRRRKKVVERVLSPDELLLENLKETRLRLAKRDGIPAYMVFTDRTLIEIVQKKPQTLSDFAAIEGVGERKLVKYWRPFVSEVCRALGRPAPTARGNSEEETLELFNRGFEVEQIAQIKEIQPSTVYNHLAHLIDADRITDFRRLITRPQYLRVMTVRDREPDTWGETLRSEFPNGFVQMALAISRYLLRHAK